jgi:hypothetical protein
VDVLLREEDLSRADDLLARAGWRRRRSPVLPNPKHLTPLVHAEGVPIELHWRLLIPHYTLPYDALWERSRVEPVGGADVRVLAEPDALLHAVAHGMSEPSGLRWLVDAWFLLEKHPRFDWATFTETTAAARLELPVSAALRYLADELGAPVPRDVIAPLESAAGRSGLVGRAAAQPWPARRAFPPPVQFALHYDVPIWTVPFYYVYRLARFAGARRSAE